MACRSKKKAEASKKKIVEMFPKAKKKLFVAEIDVSDFRSISKFIQFIKSTHQLIDVLINNAGIAINEPGITEEMARDTSQTNYFGTSFLCL